MASDTALDLSQIDPPQWRVLVNGTVYGPYTLGQMQSYIRERRVGSQTRVADGDGGAFLAASEQERLKTLFESSGRADEETEAKPANFLIIARLAGTGEMQLLGALNRLGKFAEVMPGVWALRSKVRQAKVRERLQATITSGDQIMIANTSTGRLGWLNLGPEADVHIRRVWDAELD